MKRSELVDLFDNMYLYNDNVSEDLKEKNSKDEWLIGYYKGVAVTSQIIVGFLQDLDSLE